MQYAMHESDAADLRLFECAEFTQRVHLLSGEHVDDRCDEVGGERQICRFKLKAPLNKWNPATFYAEGGIGYTDYPALPEAAE